MPLVEPKVRVEQPKLSYRCRKDTAAVVERLLVLPNVRVFPTSQAPDSESFSAERF